jgi:hypothetical protein
LGAKKNRGAHAEQGAMATQYREGRLSQNHLQPLRRRAQRNADSEFFFARSPNRDGAEETDDREQQSQRAQEPTHPAAMRCESSRFIHP